MASDEEKILLEPESEETSITRNGDEPRQAGADPQGDVEMPSTSHQLLQSVEGSNESSGLPEARNHRKKRFSSRSYRVSGNSAFSSSDDSSDENEHPLNVNKRSRHTNHATNPPTADGDDPAAQEEAENGRDEEESEESASSSSPPSSDTDSSSESNYLGPNNDSNSDLEDEDVEFLNVERPKYTWFALRELFCREHGLRTNGPRRVSKSNVNSFQKRVCGSLNSVERLELMYKMEAHDGCVNSLNFSHDGRLLASGSDDRQVILWNWASNSIATAFASGHYSNVFQTKFYGSHASGIRLITTARDGLVRCHTVPSSGGTPSSSTLFKHIGAVHGVSVIRQSPFEILTAGEDGMVIHVDMREVHVSRLVTVKENRRKVVLYGLASHPLKEEFCVYGQNRAIKIYDRRNTKEVVKEYFPQDLAQKKSVVTCARYNHLGTEIIGSYSDQDIYLFGANDAAGHFQHQYRGHCNSQTIKGVNFYGAGCEFVVSGSDCGNVFFWDKKTSKIVQWFQGDENGVVNVLEPHPEYPILATSGLDSDVKIWVPSNEKPPDLSNLEKCVRENLKSRRRAASTDMFDNEMFNLVVQERLRRMADPNQGFVLTTELQTESDAEDNWENNSSSSSSEDGASLRRRAREVFPCSPM